MVARSEGTSVQDVNIPYPMALTAQSPLLNREAAVSVDASVPMGARAREIYEAFVAADSEARDFSAIIQAKLLTG